MKKLATICFISHGGCTLMLSRWNDENSTLKGNWSALGGTVEDSESPEECVLREVKEEAGLALQDLALKGLLTLCDTEDGSDWYVYVFTASEFEGQLQDTPEEPIAWIPNQDLLDLNLKDCDRIFIPWLQQTGIFSAKFIMRGRLVQSYTVVFYV